VSRYDAVILSTRSQYRYGSDIIDIEDDSISLGYPGQAREEDAASLYEPSGTL
jgi:hypothetical protein